MPDKDRKDLDRFLSEMVGLSHNAAVELTAFYATSILNSKGGF